MKLFGRHQRLMRHSAAASAFAVVLAGVVVTMATPAAADTSPPSGTPATVSADALPTVADQRRRLGPGHRRQHRLRDRQLHQGAAAGCGRRRARRGRGRQHPRLRHHAPGNLISLVQPHPERAGPGITASPDGCRDLRRRRLHHRRRPAPATTSPRSTPRPARWSRRSRRRSRGQVRGDRRDQQHGLRRWQLLQRRRRRPHPSRGVRRRPTARCCPGRRRPTTARSDAMVLTPDRLTVIVGGPFTTLNGTVVRTAWAAVDATTGAILPWAANQIIQDCRHHGAHHRPDDRRHQIYGTGYAFGAGAQLRRHLRRRPVHRRDQLAQRLPRRHLRQSTRSARSSTASSHAHDCTTDRRLPGHQPADSTGSTRSRQTTYAPPANTGPDTYGWNSTASRTRRDPALVPRPRRRATTPARARPRGASPATASTSPWAASSRRSTAWRSRAGPVRRARRTRRTRAARLVTASDRPRRRSSVAPGRATSASAGRRLGPGQRDPDLLGLPRPARGTPDLHPRRPTPTSGSCRRLGFIDTGLAPARPTPTGSGSPTRRQRPMIRVSDTVTVSPAEPQAPTPRTWSADGAAQLLAAGRAQRPTATTTPASTTSPPPAVSPAARPARSPATATRRLDLRRQRPASRPRRAPIAGPNIFSLEAWVKTTSTSGGKIIGFGNASTGNSAQLRPAHLHGQRRARLLRRLQQRRLPRSPVADRATTTAQWHHVVGTLDGAGMTLYVDGKQIGRNDGTTRPGLQRLLARRRRQPQRLAEQPTATTSPAPSTTSRSTRRRSTARPGRSALQRQRPDARHPADARRTPTARPSTTTTRTSTGGSTRPAAPPRPTRARTATDGALHRRRDATARPARVTGRPTPPSPSTAPTATSRRADAVTNPTVYSEELWFKTTHHHGGKLIGFGDRSGPARAATTTGTSTCSNAGQLALRHLHRRAANVIDTRRAPTTTASGTTWSPPRDRRHEAVRRRCAGRHQPADRGPGLHRLLAGRRRHAPGAAQQQLLRRHHRRGRGLLHGALRAATVQRTTTAAAAASPNQPPTAAFTSTCTGLTVPFDGSGSSDPDGTIASYAWDFGDGGTAHRSHAEPHLRRGRHLHGHADGDRQRRRDRHVTTRYRDGRRTSRRRRRSRSTHRPARGVVRRVRLDRRRRHHRVVRLGLR